MKTKTTFPSLRSFVRLGAARLGLLAVMATLSLGASLGPAHALEEGSYVFQCSCPLEWNDEWDGNGVLDEDVSLDTVALVHDNTVLFLHEMPIMDGAITAFVEDRTSTLEDIADDVEETTLDAGQEDWVLIGRTWENADGDTMVGVQYVLVWEVNFVMNIEFIAPEDEFLDSWDALDGVLLVGLPVLDEFDGEDLFSDLT